MFWVGAWQRRPERALDATMPEVIARLSREVL
jgi:hypothetical protein